MLAHPQGRAPVRSARLLLSAARPGVRVSLFSRADPASSDLGLGPTGFGKDPHCPRVSAEDSRGIHPIKLYGYDTPKRVRCCSWRACVLFTPMSSENLLIQRRNKAPRATPHSGEQERKSAEEINSHLGHPLLKLLARLFVEPLGGTTTGYGQTQQEKRDGRRQ
ncbi:hypothetical protein NDU88_003743 [Pleurodeles waltl]|uniref:Uncharacterized protein n=1 Tax=Pleurodeles waltl TaxID=8319 RepID=A0AAV7UCY2_PLEWA|nr:hypothetical protein NDU88_003743 [Pleurodeles waltl]